MIRQWERARLGEVLRLDIDPVTIDSFSTYPMVGVLSFGRGLFDREPVENGKTSYRVFYRLKADHIVMSQLFGWEGALALSSEGFAGKFVSPQFPTFLCDGNRLDRHFLGWFMRRPAFWEDLASRTSGMGDRRRTLNPDALFASSIPLPSLREQRRIADRISDLATRVEQACDLRRSSRAEAEALLASMLSRRCTSQSRRPASSGESARELLARISRFKFNGQVAARKQAPMALPEPPKVPDTWAIVQAGELQKCGAILDIQDGNHGSDYPRKAEFSDEGVPFVTAKQLDNGSVAVADAPRLGQERASRLRIGFARGGDVLLTHNASVGDVAIAPSDAGNFLIGTSVTYWRCNPEALRPKYLYYFMRSQHFQSQLQFVMKQTTRNQVSVLKQVNLWIVLPPVAEQDLIIAELDALEEQLSRLTRLQTETATELDALLPAILDKAFKGEL